MAVAFNHEHKGSPPRWCRSMCRWSEKFPSRFRSNDRGTRRRSATGRRKERGGRATRWRLWLGLRGMLLLHKRTYVGHQLFLRRLSCLLLGQWLLPRSFSVGGRLCRRFLHIPGYIFSESMLPLLNQILSLETCLWELPFSGRLSRLVIPPINKQDWLRNHNPALLISPLATYITRVCGTRTTLLLGVALETLALISASFTHEIWQLFLSQGICFGFGMGFLFVGSVGIVPQWFTKKRSLANGISTAGSGLGGLMYSKLSFLSYFCLIRAAAWAARSVAGVNHSWDLSHHSYPIPAEIYWPRNH